MVEQFSFSDGADFALQQARLKRLMARCGVPEGGWEDCVQETWLAFLHEHPDWALDDPRTWRWLRRVARNKALDFHREALRHGLVSLNEQALILDAAADPLLPDDQDRNPATTASPEVATIEAVLREFTEVNRMIYILHAREGLNYTLIAERLGLTLHQVRDRYNRVVHEVRSRFEVLSTHGSMVGGGGRRRGRRRTRVVPDESKATRRGSGKDTT